jgi:hypothetical protein
VVEFRKEVAAWLAAEFKGHEHLRWSASWSTREDAEEYKFRAACREIGRQRLAVFRCMKKNTAAPS